MQCELRKAKYLEIDRLVRTGPLELLKGWYSSSSVLLEQKYIYSEPACL